MCIEVNPILLKDASSTLRLLNLILGVGTDDDAYLQIPEGNHLCPDCRGIGVTNGYDVFGDRRVPIAAPCANYHGKGFVPDNSQ